MTSKQVMLTLALLLLGGCVNWFGQQPAAEPLLSPYPTRRVWAVAPLRNESGSLQADGAAMADHLARQLENASNIDVLAVNRSLQAMRALQMQSISSPGDAQKLLAALGADYLLIGTITAYDSYDPPKIGMSLELFTSQKLEYQRMVDLRRLSSSATDRNVTPPPANALEPVSRVSAFLDAADPQVRGLMEKYVVRRGQEEKDDSLRLYRINMDLYSEFVSYVMSWRLMQAERQRFAPTSASQPAH